MSEGMTGEESACGDARLSKLGDLKRDVLSELWKIPIFDVHSHYCSEGGEVEGGDAYIGAWTQPEMPPTGLSDEALQDWRRSRWDLKKSMWMSRAFRPVLRDLYQTDDPEAIGRAMNEVRHKGLVGSMNWMRDKANVEYLVVDSNPDLAAENDWILSTYRLDASSIIDRPCDLGARLDEVDREVGRLQKAGGVNCFKVPIAYVRSLYMDDVPQGRAAKIVEKAPGKRTAEEQKEAEDYIYRHFFRKAADWSLPVEIHTGFGWAIGARPLRLSEADPENLLPILEDPEYRSTQFILFHGGYPFLSKMGYIAGSFSNVHLDFTCLCPESWTMLKRGLHEWIDIVPMDRIVTGSDGSYEWLYFAGKYNREALAEVLAEKISNEYMDMELAVEVGRHVLRDNARRVFGVG
jgi:predicted TIM-barrel fold metal-dependent hydrolase